MKPRMRTKDGSLTAHALSCGCVEQFLLGEESVTLWREYTVYNVRRNPDGAWEVYHTLADAKAAFRHFVKLLKGERS
jgi:hypothetical protein